MAGGTTSYSTFAQYFTGTYTDNSGATVSYTVGDTVTPSTVAFTPASSNCQTTATISNGLAVATRSSSSGSSGSSNGSSGGSGSGSSSSRTGKSCLRLSGYVFSIVIQRAGRQHPAPVTPLFPSSLRQPITMASPSSPSSLVSPQSSCCIKEVVFTFLSHEIYIHTPLHTFFFAAWIWTSFTSLSI